MEEIGLILLRLTGHFPATLLHRRDGSGTLVMTAGTLACLRGDGAAEGAPSARERRASDQLKPSPKGQRDAFDLSF